MQHFVVHKNARFFYCRRKSIEFHLNFNRIYVFAIGQNDNFLFAAGDVQIALFVEIAQIAGMQPAIF